MGAIHDEGEGEYEGYCCHEILLTRFQQSFDVILLSEVQEMTERTRWSFMYMLYSRPTWRRSRRVRTDSHPSFRSYLTVNVYACSSPTPALAKTWTLSMETSTGGTQISRFVKFRTPISLFTTSSPLVSVRFSRRGTSKSTKHIPTEFKRTLAIHLVLLAMLRYHHIQPIASPSINPTTSHIHP